MNKPMIKIDTLERNGVKHVFILTSVERLLPFFSAVGHPLGLFKSCFQVSSVLTCVADVVDIINKVSNRARLGSSLDLKTGPGVH